MSNEERVYTTVYLRLPKSLMDDFDRYSQEKGYQSRKLAFIDMIKKEIGK